MFPENNTSINMDKVFRCSHTIVDKKGKKRKCHNKNRGHKLCHHHRNNKINQLYEDRKDAIQLYNILEKMVNTYNVDKVKFIDILTSIIHTIKVK